MFVCFALYICVFCFCILNQDANVNGNANEALTATRDSALIEETQLTTTDIQPVTNDVIEMKHTDQLAAAADAAAEETQRKEDELDTEVSQINTQSTQKTAQSTADAGDSSSRPMSRTSTMTPVNRFLISANSLHLPLAVLY